jgi:hypothetical protein
VILPAPPRSPALSAFMFARSYSRPRGFGEWIVVEWIVVEQIIVEWISVEQIFVESSDPAPVPCVVVQCLYSIE